MKQSEIVAAVAGGQATWKWVPLADGLEVMAWPVRIGRVLVAVTARTASACAAALSRDGWIVSLTTPKVEDLVFENATLRPEPVLLNPQRINIASDKAIEEHSTRLLARFGAAADDALVVAGKSWVLSNGLLDRPGRAANYGMFSSSAPHRSATGAFHLWQPLSFAHNLDHSDYSQLLRLVRRRPGVALPSYDQPLRIFELGGAAAPTPPAPAPSAPVASEPFTEGVAQGTLGERCLAWCLEEAAEHHQPSADRIAWYHAVAVRNGKPLGIKTGNHCASAQSRALVECILPGEVKPHEPRAAAKELRDDAAALGRWRPIAEVRAGKWQPRPGDLAIYTRANPADPKTAWQRHVDRVIRVHDDGSRYENIGANEVAGAWNREWTSFEHSRLLGFVEYPGIPLSESERAGDGVALRDQDVG
jgi:hypothetical protein